MVTAETIFCLVLPSLWLENDSKHDTLNNRILSVIFEVITHSIFYKLIRQNRDMAQNDPLTIKLQYFYPIQIGLKTARTNLYVLCVQEVVTHFM